MLSFNKKPTFTPSLTLDELAAYLHRPSDVLVLDTETIGSSGLIEISELTVADLTGKILISEFVKPIYNKTTALYLKDSQLGIDSQKRKTWAEIYPKLQTVTTDKLLLAYNASFDRRVIQAELSRMQPVGCLNEQGWRCVMGTIKSRLNLKNAISLEDAYNMVNLNRSLESAWHTAEWDVLCTVKLVNWLVNE